MDGSRTTSSADVLARAGVDLHVELASGGLRAGLAAALREAVRSGRLAAGTRLPASRALAADLGIARSTVTEAYAELVAEGWLVGRQGSGTRVAERVRPSRSRPVAPGGAQESSGLETGAAQFTEFPRAPWLAAARRALADAPASVFGYGDPLGLPALRSALADYLFRVRGVVTEPEHVVVTSGFHHGLGLLAQALRRAGVEAVAVESSGLGLYRDVLQVAGLRIPPLTVDEDGAQVAALGDLADVGAVLLTPAHQFPTGYALSAERRAAVLDWARSTGGIVLEDDYDGEFRYDRKPAGALQGLDPDHVVYLGTASKSLAPALRLGWMVVPPHLLPGVAAAKGRMETASVLDQLVLAELVTSGAFDRHVRGRRQTYRRRREQLVETVARSAPSVRVAGMDAGLQVVLELPAGTERAVHAAAQRRGLTVSAMGEFLHPSGGPSAARPDALVVSVTGVPDSAWPGVLRVLGEVLGESVPTCLATAL